MKKLFIVSLVLGLNTIASAHACTDWNGSYSPTQQESGTITPSFTLTQSGCESLAVNAGSWGSFTIDTRCIWEPWAVSTDAWGQDFGTSKEIRERACFDGNDMLVIEHEERMPGSQITQKYYRNGYKRVTDPTTAGTLLVNVIQLRLSPTEEYKDWGAMTVYKKQ